jgi:hypothetical protein
MSVLRSWCSAFVLTFMSAYASFLAQAPMWTRLWRLPWPWRGTSLPYERSCSWQRSVGVASRGRLYFMGKYLALWPCSELHVGVLTCHLYEIRTLTHVVYWKRICVCVCFYAHRPRSYSQGLIGGVISQMASTLRSISQSQSYFAIDIKMHCTFISLSAIRVHVRTYSGIQ